mgnify:CR=1 FL=1
MAVAREKRNAFIVKAAFDDVPPERRDWWRPGMTGIGRLDAGNRTLIWLATHRTIDFLRLRLWW